MSTEISLVALGIKKVPTPLQVYAPYVVAEMEALGFSTLKHTLEYHESITGLVALDEDESEPGLRRYYVLNPTRLAEHIEESPSTDWEGLNGAVEVVEMLRQYPNCTWWFHVNS